MADSFDIAIVGGGIVGASAAAFAAEAGLSIVLVERESIAAAASGRNSGAVQHPFDPVLSELHTRTVALYREMSTGTDFQLPTQAAGLLLLSAEADRVTDAADSIGRQSPDLLPAVLDGQALHALEPALAPGLVACRLETGYPVAPAAATNAFAARARAAGARLEIGEAAEVVIDGQSATGVRLSSGNVINAGQVLVAAGPWTPNLIPGWRERPPIRPLWGVVVSATLAQPPHAVLEELGLHQPGPQPDELFSLVTAGADTSVGSTFLAEQPDPHERAPAILARASRFVPTLAGVQPVRVRACARPVSLDARPFVGAVSGIDRLFVCAGHGPWGISTGPASAELVIQAMFGGRSVPTPLSAARVVS